METKSIINVGCAQINCELGNISSNKEKHLKYISYAKENNVDLLVFPELSLTGYSMSKFGRNLAMPSDSYVLKELANELGNSLSIVVGFVEDGPSGLVYNSSAFISKGQIDFVHRKMSLPTFGQWDEGKYYAEGRSLDICNWTDQWKLSTLICQDVWQPSLVHIAAMKGTTLFICPFCSTKWTKGRGYDSATGWDIVQKYIAMTYGMPAIFCNRVGQEEGYEFWGRSKILNAYGKVLCEAGEIEELIFAQLNFKELQDARYASPIIRDCRIDTTIRELQKAATGDFCE